MFSHARTSHSHKSKNPKGHDEDSGRVNLSLHNLSKLQSSKTLFAPAKESRKPPPSIDCDKLQELTLQKTSMKLSVQPEKESNDEYENEADDDFCPSSQQPFQPANHGLKENLFDEDKDVSTSNH